MPEDPLRDLDPERLRSVLDAVVPGGADHPSATAAGGVDFLRRVLTHDRPEWTDRFRQRALATLSAAPSLNTVDSDPDVAWLCDLVVRGYLAEPGSEGNRDGTSWRPIAWRTDPAGGWPAGNGSAGSGSARNGSAGNGSAGRGSAGRGPAGREQDRRAVIGPDRLAGSYDVVVVGAGAGGGVAAALLAEAGRRVLVVEAGGWPDTAELATDHLRNPRAAAGLGGPTVPGAEHPRTVLISGERVPVVPADGGWSGNASTVGGGTRVYGAQAWRFHPADFRMASEYGVPEGSALADWPIGYDELEPYYTRAEWELGVAGEAGGGAGFRSRGYPMGPLARTAAVEPLVAGAAALGWRTQAPPLLVNSTEYGGRRACLRCPQCIGFACPVEAKSGSHNTTLVRATATGRCDILVRATAERVVTGPGGRVTGVALVGEGWRREVAAGQVVLAAGAVETARLLLNSASEREPAGLGNGTDQVGRYLQGHVYGGARGVFGTDVVDLAGPGPAIATLEFQHGNAGIVGGGMLANEFVPTPANTYGMLRELGLVPAHGSGVMAGMRAYARRVHQVMGPIQQVSTANARVRLDPAVRDRFGNPVAALAGGPHPEDLRAQRFLAERAAEWLAAAGAGRVVPMGPAPATGGPPAGQHQAGTCRMGDDPARSVVDPEGRVWGHDNLRVVDGSVHVTNGGVNPVLTILANAYRTTSLLLRST
jgi:choline dehydrogenase-like flavoprotein